MAGRNIQEQYTRFSENPPGQQSSNASLLVVVWKRLACGLLFIVLSVLLYFLLRRNKVTAPVHVVDCSVLFVGYDAGETLAFLEVAPALASVLPASNLPPAFLVMATAATMTTVASLPPTVQVVHMEDLGVHVDINAPRTTPLPDGAASAVAARICPSATLVVTGGVSVPQLEIARAFRMRVVPTSQVFGGRDGTPVAVFVDAFNWSNHSIFATFVHDVDAALASSNESAYGIHSLAPSLPIAVVGNPTTDAWVREARRGNRTEMRERLVGNGWKGHVIAYAGGYGKMYADGFRLWVRACFLIVNGRCIVSLHPKMDGSLEKLIVKEENATGVVLFAPKAISTPVIVNAADQVTCMDSTVGVQALFIGRPSIFLAPPGDCHPASSLAVRYGLSPLVHNASAYVAALDTQAQSGFFFDPTRLHTQAGVPTHPTAAFVEWLLAFTALR